MTKLQKNLQPLSEQGQELLGGIKAPAFEHLAVGGDGQLQVVESKARLKPAHEDIVDLLDEDKLREKIGCQIGPFQDGSILFTGPRARIDPDTCEVSEGVEEAPQCNVNEDNDSFFWDGGNRRMGLETNAPRTQLHGVGDARFDDGGPGAPTARVYALGSRTVPSGDSIGKMEDPSPTVDAGVFSMTADGLYVAVVGGTDDTFKIYKRGCESNVEKYLLLSETSVEDGADIADVNISKDGTLVVATFDNGETNGQRIKIYSHSDGLATLLQEITPAQGTGSANVVNISGNNQFVGYGRSNANPTLLTFKRLVDPVAGTQTWIRTTDPDPDTIAAFGLQFSDNGQWMRVTGGGGIHWYHFNALLNQYQRQFNASPGGAIIGSGMDGNGVYTVVRHNDTPIVTVFKRHGFTFTDDTSAFDSLPASSNAPGPISISSDSRFVALGSSDAPRLWMYKRNGDSFTRLEDPSPVPGNDVISLSISGSGSHIPVRISLVGGPSDPEGFQVYENTGEEEVSGVAVFSDGALRVEDFTLRDNGGEDDDEVLWVRDAADSAFAGLKAASLFVTEKIGVGTDSPATSADLEISSTEGALLLSRMTTVQRDALTAVDGMVLYDSTLDEIQFREGGAWLALVKDHDDLGGVTSDQHHAQQHGSADHDAESDAEAIHDDVVGEIAAITEKSTVVGADLLLAEDSAATNAKKKIQVDNLPKSNFLVAQVFNSV